MIELQKRQIQNDYSSINKRKNSEAINKTSSTPMARNEVQTSILSSG